MAVFRGSAIVGTISGRVGGTVFVTSPGGGVVRAAGVRTGAPSAAASAAQGQLVAAKAAWQSMSDSRRAAWKAFALGVVRVNRVGVAGSLSGLQAFVRYSMTNLDGVASSSQDPPAANLIVAPVGMVVYMFAEGPWAVSVVNLAATGATVEERYMLQRRITPLQRGGFSRYALSAVGSRTWPAVDFGPTGSAWRAGSVLDGATCAVGLSWSLPTGIFGARYWATSVVGDAPWIFDDFAGTLDGYDGTTTRYSIVSSPLHVGSGTLRWSYGGPATVNDPIWRTTGTAYWPIRGHIWEYWIYYTGAPNECGCLFGVSDADNNYEVESFPGGTIRIRVRVAGTPTVVCTAALAAFSSATWYRMVVSWASDGSMSVEAFDSGGSSLGSASGSDSTYSNGYSGFRCGSVSAGGGDWYLNRLRITASAG